MDNITQIRPGIHQDNSLVEQPKNKLRFALNAVDSSDEGDMTFISNEESNEECGTLTSGYTPIGKVYIGNGDTVIFSVKNDETLSQIGILNSECNYSVILSFDLGFTLSTQIDATFRLVRGCERVIYWVDPKIRHLNIDRPEKHKITGATQIQVDTPSSSWDLDKLYLIKRYDKIPVFDSFEVQESGRLKPGSYSFAIQYLDEDFNPTEFIISTEHICIYNDLLTKPINFIRGSSTLKTNYKDFPDTNKSIKITLDNLSESFPFYRLAILESTSANGTISSVKYTAPISTSQPVFSYTGYNFESVGSIEEVQQQRSSITEASSIEQIENRLILGNVKYTQVNFCKLQKYASKIIANPVIKPNSSTNTLDRSNKNPLNRVDQKVSYMEGEIYSFGIQYYFEDNTISPVFHIPGRNHLDFISSDMSTDNELDNTYYTDNTLCEDYWGEDYRGDALKGEKVRHHRFPLRSEISGDASSYANEFLGIAFSNIEKPSLDDTGGLVVIGYQIVRQERDRDNTTVVDNGLLIPILEGTNDYCSNSVLVCTTADKTKILPNIFCYISLQNLFNNSGKPYINPTSILSQGYYPVFTGRIMTSVITQDVAPGTSYDPEVHRRRDRDTDGFDLHTLSRLNGLANNRFAHASIKNYGTIEECFYLDSLDSVTKDGKKIVNTQADNRCSFIKLAGSYLDTNLATTQNTFDEKLPHITLMRPLTDPYSNFRYGKYYAECEVQEFTSTPESVSIYNGDVYLNEFVYCATSFYDVGLYNRTKKKGLLNAIVGVLGIIAGIALIATGVGIAPGLLSIGFGVSQIATGVKQSNIAKVYQDLYEDGLRDSLDDSEIGPILSASPAVNTDDEIQWFMDTISGQPNSTTKLGVGIRIESSVNAGLREGATKGSITDFLSMVELTTATPTTSLEDPITDQDYYLIDKLTLTDTETEAGKLYKGYPNAEIYELNPDYQRVNNGKIFYHLPIEYDCCSDCVESFPHRIQYSQQSFQEELTDNYTIFLPNNYRDIEGEKGVIKDIFKIQNNLYIHTEEALWHLPQNIQERVTNQIVSFIGTGDFFSIPPRKIVDSNDASAGTLHKWARTKTPYGVFFPSYRDKSFYLFNGNTLDRISDKDISSWIRENIEFRGYNLYDGNIDNPSNIDGLGFVSVYDSDKERIIITKKDFIEDSVDVSWTLSYSIRTKSWISWHSYLPVFYIFTNNNFYSWKYGVNKLWKHNVKGSFQSFYGDIYPHIIEYVSLSTPIQNRIWESIVFHTTAKKYIVGTEDYVNRRLDTFDKVIIYNSRQCTGELTMEVKDRDAVTQDYMTNQIKNNINTITIDNNEGNWSINNFRDIVVDQDSSLFKKDRASIDTAYFMDKIVNEDMLDPYKDWSEMEVFRDKYLVIRFIFNNFTGDIKLVSNYSLENEKPSIR